MYRFFSFFVFFLSSAVVFAASPGELFEDGGFDHPSINPVADTEQGVVLEGENRVFQLIRHGHRIEWTPPTGPIWNAEYVLSFRIKANDTAGSRICLWNRLPDQHEPPEGPLFSQYRTGTFDWTDEEVRFKMPAGISRFIVFLDHNNSKGWCRIDDISIRPVDDAVPSIDANQKHVGSPEREQTCWIWANNDYPWTPAHNHNQEFAKPAAKEENVLFRRSFVLPPEAANVQAIFCGDDFATLSIDGKTVGQNQNLQDIAKIPLDLQPGKHDVQFTVDNKFGPGGLAGRIEWTDAQGNRSLIATNDRWESSIDNGKTWKPATVLTVVTPAPTQFHWIYPHLEKLTYRLHYSLPNGATQPRLALRSTGGFSVSCDDQPPIEGTSAGKVMKMELAQGRAKNVMVELSDISQPPWGQGTLLYLLNGKAVSVPIEDFKTEDGQSPESGNAFYPGRGWPHNIATFDAAASLPQPSFKHEYQDWQKELLKGAQPLWTLGQTDNSSEEFAPFSANGPKTEPIILPLRDTKQCPRGLELRWQPELTLQFNLVSIPQSGAVFELNVEDADAMVTQVAVFVNGLFVGMPQVIGYDQIPGGRTTNRSWLVTIPAERFVRGRNSLTLRLVPSSYTKIGEVVNQSDEYIKLMNLRNRNENPYPASDWLHWDMLALYALPQEVAEPINGRPVFMGTSIGYLALDGFPPFEEYILRDLEYLGMKQSRSPIRLGIWDRGQYDRVTPEGLDKQLNALNERGMSPYILFEPGRLCNSWEDFEKSTEVEIMKKHGSKIVAVEIGNEVDHPGYGWDQMAMSVAYATIQKQAVMGQALKKYADNPNLRIMGEGWYHAWNYGVIDAQARQEAPNDPGFTDDLSAHNYGRSYIQPALTYYSLYGANLGDPKPIWVTECGSWTPNDENVFEFDVNLRGNISYVTFIVQYLLYPYDHEMRQFSMLTAQSADAQILEKARIFRRLLHAYALHGKPVGYRILNAAELKDQLVLVNPVLTDGGVKLAFVNFSDRPQKIEAEFTLPKSGTLTGKRYGDGETVTAGTKQAELKASPKLLLKETLSPGETVLYDCTIK